MKASPPTEPIRDAVWITSMSDGRYAVALMSGYLVRAYWIKAHAERHAQTITTELRRLHAAQTAWERKHKGAGK